MFVHLTFGRNFWKGESWRIMDQRVSVPSSFLFLLIHKTFPLSKQHRNHVVKISLRLKQWHFITLQNIYTFKSILCLEMRYVLIRCSLPLSTFFHQCIQLNKCKYLNFFMCHFECCAPCFAQSIHLFHFLLLVFLFIIQLLLLLSNWNCQKWIKTTARAHTHPYTYRKKDKKR